VVNSNVILGHVTIGEPLFGFAAAASTTDLLNFPTASTALSISSTIEPNLSFNNNFGGSNRTEND
jgi:hypothetical protein